MPLVKEALSTRIQTEIIAIYGVADDASKLKDFADAIAKAIVEEILTNAVVTVNNVTNGPSSATGTIT